MNYSCVALTNDNKALFAVGNDRNLKDYFFADGAETKKEIGVLLSQICFTQSNKILFAGVCDENRSAGSIRCYRFPVTGQFYEYQVCIFFFFFGSIY